MKRARVWRCGAGKVWRNTISVFGSEEHLCVIYYFSEPLRSLHMFEIILLYTYVDMHIYARAHGCAG